MATRYQLRFRDDADKLLNWMSRELKIEPKDVILDALALYHFAVMETKEARQVGSYDSRTLYGDRRASCRERV